MLLRIVRGTVLPGREDDFVAISRRQVDAGAQAPGLLAFMAGYRRVQRSDHYILASTWLDAASLAAAAPDDPLGGPAGAGNLAGVGSIDSIDDYELIEPLHPGILAAPGALLRTISATVQPGRVGELLDWVRHKDREITVTRTVLSRSMGHRRADGRDEVFSITAWASPLQLESMAEEGRAGKTLFAILDEWLTDVRIDHYQAIELRLPDADASVGGARLIAARFDSEHAALTARAEIEASIASARDAGVYVARLGGSGAADQFLLVARTSLAEHGCAERAIVDAGGQVVYETNETAPPPAPTAPAFAEQPAHRPIT